MGYHDREDISVGMVQVYLKYKAAEVPAELHVYSNAGHGFGYRPDAKPTPASAWVERFQEWLAGQHFLD
jgi:endo-1,4-beta-xylanase